MARQGTSPHRHDRVRREVTAPSEKTRSAPGRNRTCVGPVRDGLCGECAVLCRAERVGREISVWVRLERQRTGDSLLSLLAWFAGLGQAFDGPVFQRRRTPTIPVGWRRRPSAPVSPHRAIALARGPGLETAGPIPARADRRKSAILFAVASEDRAPGPRERAFSMPLRYVPTVAAQGRPRCQ